MDKLILQSNSKYIIFTLKSDEVIEEV